MTRYGPNSSNDYDGHRLAPAHRNRDVLDANGNRITPENALVKYLDAGSLDEAEFDETAFEFDRGKRGVHGSGIKMLDHAGIAALGEAEPHLGRRIALIDGGHGLYFQPRARRSSAAD